MTTTVEPTVDWSQDQMVDDETCQSVLDIINEYFNDNLMMI